MSEWRAIPSWGNYSVNEAGQIKRVASGKGARVGRILRPTVGARGYPVVKFYIGSKQISLTVHTLVASAFLGPRPEGMEVCHENGNRQDARIANLRYGTRRDNVDDALRHGSMCSGERHPYVVAADAAVLAALKDALEIGLAPAARKHGVNRATLWDVMHGKSRRYLLAQVNS